jgi:hypothetical protein
MAHSVKKTEHAGAKNGGGHWGCRAEAKAGSRRRRRALDRRVVRDSEWEDIQRRASSAGKHG